MYDVVGVYIPIGIVNTIELYVIYNKSFMLEHISYISDNYII